MQPNTHMQSPWEWLCVKGTGDENHSSDTSRSTGSPSPSMQVPGLATHCTEPGQWGVHKPPSNTKSRLRVRHHHLKELGPSQPPDRGPGPIGQMLKTENAHLEPCPIRTISHTAVMLPPELPWLHRYQGNSMAEGRCRDPKQRLAVVLALLCCCFNMNKKPVDIRKPQKISLKLQNSTENIVQLRPSAQCTHAYSAS